MAKYEVHVAADDRDIVLEVAGDVDASAGKHVLELAQIALGGLRRSVCIDVDGVRSITAGGAKLLSPDELQRIAGAGRIRTRGRISGPGTSGRPPSGGRSDG